jgi:hypothetical protein
VRTSARSPPRRIARSSLSIAYSGRAERIATVNGPQIKQALLGFLESSTQDTTCLIAVPSAMQGVRYVIATGGRCCIWAASWARRRLGYLGLGCEQLRDRTRLRRHDAGRRHARRHGRVDAGRRHARRLSAEPVHSTARGRAIAPPRAAIRRGQR